MMNMEEVNFCMVMVDQNYTNGRLTRLLKGYTESSGEKSENRVFSQIKTLTICCMTCIILVLMTTFNYALLPKVS